MSRIIVKLAKTDAPLNDVVINIDDNEWTIHVKADAGQTDLFIKK